MNTSFDPWLLALAAGSKGGFVMESASRTRRYVFGINAAADFTGATIRAQVRSAPDAAGSPLATFAVTGPVVAAGISTFTLELVAGSGANSTGILPADSTGDGVIYLPVDVLLTPLGGSEELLFGAALPLLGRITL